MLGENLIPMSNATREEGRLPGLSTSPHHADVSGILMQPCINLIYPSWVCFPTKAVASTEPSVMAQIHRDPPVCRWFFPLTQEHGSRTSTVVRSCSDTIRARIKLYLHFIGVLSKSKQVTEANRSTNNKGRNRSYCLRCLARKPLI